MQAKKPNDSEISMSELVLPNDTNLLGNLLGGRLMHWIDIAGGMAASRHANSVVVTAAVDSLVFDEPVHLGEIVRLNATLTWVGRSSMEVKVEVYAENIETKQVRKTNEAYLVYVALDKNRRPKEVPQLILETEEEKKEFENAQKRREIRLSSPLKGED